ncbi:hypothetical protein K2173_027975 [Erythroxylum novogranatense]|uniref:Uncharacterized protein n=1 Tax=Erythroxylum novogranatense TaxID=1862640 RepID=A0AAV8U0T0_9ROSI|nr:hypothetical protein K2173_027975 [Erythroxylum novogranatense]
MEDSTLSPGAMLRGSAGVPVDFDYMDQLLLDGCWLEATDGSEFINLSPSNTAALTDPSFPWFASENNNNCDSNSSSSQKSDHEDKQMSLFPKDGCTTNTQSIDCNAVSISRWERNATEDSQISRRWWIEPRADSGPGTSVTERLMKAIWYIKDFTVDKDVLVQIWVPVNREGRRVLTTHDQPFALDPSSRKLARYRDISVNYQFSAEENAKEFAGLPGRVFLDKIPEWSPDVRFFRSDEYPRVDHAQQHDVRGSLALPVFAQGSRNCLGVVEVVMTSQKIKYSPDLESVRKALEAVDLRSSEILSRQNVKASDDSYQAALPEILEVLRSACETHRLPLAQTWVSCIQQGKEGCRHSDENYSQCVSTVDHACYVVDPSIQPFHEACSEHHLLKGQGVAGQAFMTNQPCFSSDITLLGKIEYPLSHYATMFGLHAAVAIRLRSVYTGAADFVLEFFLPADCRDPEEQKKMLNALSIIIQKMCRTLRVITDKELEEESHVPVTEEIAPSNGGSTARMMPRKKHSYSGSVESLKCRQHGKGHSQKVSTECGKANFTEGSFSSLEKIAEKKRTKAEKTISLQVLRRYFSGSLKDAAKSIGVCPTTLKRICRQHGITRWPSRKIKKVGHSLQKLQLVMDSVQGASGAFQIDSFYTNYPKFTSSESSKPEVGIISSQATAPKSPSSSCSQSSNSTHSCSSATQQQCSTVNVATGGSYPTVGETSGSGALKRVESDANLHASSRKEEKPLLRSQSHVSLTEQHNLCDLPPPLPKSSDLLQSQKPDAQRVKITYGNEKIRLRMPKHWGYEDLRKEIERRFNIEAISRFDLKYLDDENEWVLLTCDDDLEECIDLCQSLQNHTIKLLLQMSPLVSGRVGLSKSL